MIAPEDLVGEEWAEWYRMTPLGHWRESQKLWQIYLDLGGSLDPEPDTQSPFFDPRVPLRCKSEHEPRANLACAGGRGAGDPPKSGRQNITRGIIEVHMV